MGSNMTCENDYVEIMEEDDTQEFVTIKTYCGEDKPAIYISTKSRIKVHYMQTVHFSGTGWSIYFMGIHDGNLSSNYF
jgi:peptide methionine sulfoxide reductase MsrB